VNQQQRGFKLCFLRRIPVCRLAGNRLPHTDS
jgi:hypothetical protein